jgi:hypothetical protein
MHTFPHWRALQDKCYYCIPPPTRYTWDTGKGKEGNIFCELNKDLRVIPKVPLSLAQKIREAWAPFMMAMINGLRYCPKVEEVTVYRGRWGLNWSNPSRSGLGLGLALIGGRGARARRRRAPSVRERVRRPGPGQLLEAALPRGADGLLVLVDTNAPGASAPFLETFDHAPTL